MRASRCVCAVTGAFLGMSVVSLANSYFVGGTIQSVGADGKSCVVEGIDHYGNKSQGLVVPIPLQLGDADCYILDGRLMRREAAMVQGRAIFDIQHRIHIVLSEPATRTLGQVVKVDGTSLSLRTLLGQDKRETNVTVEANAQYLAEGKPATRDEVLKVDGVLRVAPARPATLLAYTEKSLAKDLPATMSVAVQGVIKGDKLVFASREGGVTELARSGRTGLVLDACNPLGVKIHPGHPCLAPGSVAVAVGFVKRGAQKQLETPSLEGLESYVASFWPEPGRVDGEVVAFDAAGRKLTVKTLTADGIKETIVALPAEVQVVLDGAKSDATQALKAGTQITFFPAKPQTIDLYPYVTKPEPPPPAPPPSAAPQPAAKAPEKPAEKVQIPSL